MCGTRKHISEEMIEDFISTGLRRGDMFCMPNGKEPYGFVVCDFDKKYCVYYMIGTMANRLPGPQLQYTEDFLQMMLQHDKSVWKVTKIDYDNNYIRHTVETVKPLYGYK